MTKIAFLSAVSSEFHHNDLKHPKSFDSYRNVLMLSLRRCIKDCRVIVQEELRQGLGDLLGTLDDEIARSTIVIHVVGDMAGETPMPAEVRRLHERHANFLKHEPELAEKLTDTRHVSYTQWEAYLAFQHQRGRLVFVADASAPRSPRFVASDEQRASQSAHLERIRIAGEHYQKCYDQRDLARKAVAAIERNGLCRSVLAQRPSPEKVAAARAEASELAREVSTTLCATAKTALSDYDPAGIQAFLEAIDTASIKRELDRRVTLEILEAHRIETRTFAEEEPTPENLYELSLAEMAVGNYREAITAIQPFVERTLTQMAEDSDRKEQHREKVLTAYLLWHEACHLAGQRDEAIHVLEAGGALIDAEQEPAFWADYHEVLAEYFLDHAQWDEAEMLVDPIIDIREAQGETSPALPDSLLVWCRLLDARASYSGVVSVARRAEKLFAGQVPSGKKGVIRALILQGIGLMHSGRLAEAESALRHAVRNGEVVFGADHPDIVSSIGNLAAVLLTAKHYGEAEDLMRRALAISEASFATDHPNISAILNNLAALLYQTNRRGEAERLTLQALAISEASFGSDHPNVASNLNNLASLLKETNRLEEAEPLMRRALAIDETSFGPDHPNLVLRLWALASVLFRLIKPDEAEELYLRAISIFNEHPEIASPSISEVLEGYAVLLHCLGRDDHAEIVLRRSILEKADNPGSYHLLAMVYRRMGSSDQERSCLEAFFKYGGATPEENQEAQERFAQLS